MSMKRTVVALACMLAAFTARAEQIVVSNYAVTTNGMPFAVAIEKGYFKEFKVNVDGILTSDGGGTTIRNLLGGKLVLRRGGAFGRGVGGAGRRRPEDHQRQRAHRGRVRVGDEAELDDQLAQGPQRQEARLYQAGSTSQALAHLLQGGSRLKTSEVNMVRDRRLRRRPHRARAQQDRRGASARAALLQEPAQVPAHPCLARHPAARFPTGRHHDRRHGQVERRVPARRNPARAARRSISSSQHRGSRRPASPRPTTSPPPWPKPRCATCSPPRRRAAFPTGGRATST